MNLRKMTRVMMRVGLSLATAGVMLAGGCTIPGLDVLGDLLGGLLGS